jgi:hypothetical protein
MIYKTLQRKLKMEQYDLGCSGTISSSCSTIGTRRITLVTNPVVIHEWGYGLIVITINRTYTWSFVTQIPQRLTKSWCQSWSKFCKILWRLWTIKHKNNVHWQQITKWKTKHWWSTIPSNIDKTWAHQRLWFGSLSTITYYYWQHCWLLQVVVC